MAGARRRAQQGGTQRPLAGAGASAAAEDLAEAATPPLRMPLIYEWNALQDMFVQEVIIFPRPLQPGAEKP